MFLYSFYAVVVIQGTPSNMNQANYDDATAYMPGAAYYITAAWSGENVTRVPASYILGNESVSYANGVAYLNAKLSSGSDYTFFVWIDLKSDLDVREHCRLILLLYLYYVDYTFLSSTQVNRPLRIRTNFTTAGTGTSLFHHYHMLLL